jgi:hypothetical protein
VEVQGTATQVPACEEEDKAKFCKKPPGIWDFPGKNKIGIDSNLFHSFELFLQTQTHSKLYRKIKWPS